MVAKTVAIYKTAMAEVNKIHSLIMEYILKKGQPGLRQDFLIYGREYHVYRDGKYLGTATFSDDKIHGDVFLKKKILKSGDEALEVFVVDEWQFV